MTSFAFILGVLPLVLATGAGANARRSLGISAFAGMLASTLLAVVFVPAFFVLLQRLDEWLGKKKPPRALDRQCCHQSSRPRSRRATDARCSVPL